MRRTPVLIPGLVGLLAIVSCSGEPTGPAPGESFTLAPGERVSLAPLDMEVRFLEVSGDSRCPLRAECVWAGDGAVLLELSPRDGDATLHTLHTTEGPDALTLGRYELTLLGLDPYPELPDVIPAEDYRVELVLDERLE